MKAIKVRKKVFVAGAVRDEEWHPMGVVLADDQNQAQIWWDRMYKSSTAIVGMGTKDRIDPPANIILLSAPEMNRQHPEMMAAEDFQAWFEVERFRFAKFWMQYAVAQEAVKDAVPEDLLAAWACLVGFLSHFEGQLLGSLLCVDHEPGEECRTCSNLQGCLAGQNYLAQGAGPVSVH